MKIEKIKNGHMLKVKLGRYVENKTEPDWEYEGLICLHVETFEGRIVNLTPKNYPWAEYSLEDFNKEFNEFAIEGWHMRVLEWNM